MERTVTFQGPVTVMGLSLTGRRVASVNRAQRASWAWGSPHNRSGNPNKLVEAGMVTGPTCRWGTEARGEGHTAGEWQKPVHPRAV